MKKIFSTYRGLPKAIYVLFLVQIINRFGDFVVPFLTLYLTVKIGLKIEVVGVIVTLSALLAIPGSLLGGKFADKIGRKKTYVIAQTIAAFSLIPCAFLKKPYIIVIFILISTFFNGAVRPVIQAMVADLLPPEKRKIGFSLQYLGINIGVAVGPIAAGFLFNNYLPLLFIGDALTSFIAVTLVVLHISETKYFNKNATLHEKEETGNIFQALIKRPHIIIFLLIFMIYVSIYTQSFFALPLTLNKLFKEKGAETFGYLISVNAVTVVLLNVFMTRLTRKLPTLINLIIAGFLYAIGFGMIGYISTFKMLIVSTVLWTIGEILISINFGTYIANNSPSNFRARFSAVGSLSYATGSAIGTSIMGKFISLAGLNSLWNLTILLGGLASFLTFLLSIWSISVKRETEKITVT